MVGHVNLPVGLAVNELGKRLKKLRLEKGLSQRQLEVPGVSYAYISRIEAGTRNPSIKALIKLADKLEVNPFYLYTGHHIGDCPLCQTTITENGRY